MKLQKILFLLCLLNLTCAVAGGWFYYSSMRDKALEDAKNQAASHTEELRDLAVSVLSSNMKSIRALAGVDHLGKLLNGPDEKTRHDAERLVDHFNESLGASVTYLMDPEGFTILASNRNGPGSFEGKNYAFRPYFQSAVRGIPSLYLALGVTSNKRGIYYSHPVYQIGSNEPSGVVVVKAPIDDLENIFSQKRYRGAETITLLTGPHGVIFISDRQDLLYRTLWENDEKELAEIEGSKQFGEGPWQWSGFVRKGQEYLLDSSGSEYGFYGQSLSPLPGWQIVHLLNIKSVSQRYSNPFTETVGSITFFFVFLVCFCVFYLYRMANKVIARRQEAERALRDSEDRYRRLTENAQDLIWRTDAEGRILFVNKTVEKTLGYSSEETAFMELSKYMTEESRRKMADEIRTGLSETPKRNHFRMEIDYIRRNGDPVTCEINFIALFNEKGRISGFEGVSRDISEKIKVERQLRQSQKMESIGVLSGGIAHEFNNLLAIVLGNAELALEDIPRENTEWKFLSDIRSAAIRGRNIVRQLLSFSQESEPVKRPFNLYSVVDDSIKLLRASIGTDIEIRKSIDENCPEILGDRDAVRQALVNLCANAAQAMEERGGMLSIEVDGVYLERDEEFFGVNLPPGDYVRLAVSDTGEGIPMDLQDRVFDPFFTTRPVDGGSGMGLAVVVGIVKGHGGGVRMESQSGSGTRVECYFPAFFEHPY
jgi:PAS domain S-box-containing protein